MEIRGPATYYDGLTPRVHDVAIALGVDTLTIRDLDGTLATWPLPRLIKLDARRGELRLGSVDQPDGRLEIRDPRLVRELSAALRDQPKTPGAKRSRGLVAGGLVLAALASVGVLVVFGIPAVAAKLAPLVPINWEISIGEEVKPQIVDMLGKGRQRTVCDDAAGAAALAKLSAELVEAADPPLPVQIEVIRLPVPNAFALPGGTILVLSGLIDKVATPDELRGILAHELGHVVHRDAIRHVIETAGLSALFGLVLGDYSGSTIAVLTGRTLVDAGYSRGIEAAADAFAVTVMKRIGRDPGALGDALNHITGSTPNFGESLAWLSTHPSTPDRVAKLKAEARAVPPETLLSQTEWSGIKAICK